MADRNSLKQKILGVWGLICAKLDALRSDLTELRGETQATITANGVLKGDGNGNVSAAVAGTDYLPPSHNTASDAHTALFSIRPTMIQVGDGVWVFVDGGEGVIVINGEVTILPASKTYFRMGEYDGNNNLSVVYAPSVVTVGDGAFSDCSSLTTVSLPAATNIAGTTAGGSVFSYCSALKTVSLPSAIHIGEETFSDCSSLTTIDLSSCTVDRVRANAAYWGIIPPIGQSVTITCSDGEYIIEE